jgi:hypothetical protein
MKLKIHNRLRRIKIEIIPANLNKLIQAAIKKHRKANNFINLFIPLKAD